MSRIKTETESALAGCLIIGVVFFLIINAIAESAGVYILIWAGVFFILIISYQIYSYIFFNGQKFKAIKESIKDFTVNCNDLNEHIEDLKSSYVNIRSYNYGNSELQDNSNYNFQRKGWAQMNKNERTHNCSRIVCKNAQDQPFKYLCKYFNIKSDEETLAGFENVLNDFSAAEQGKVLLQNERESILNDISNSIPQLIMIFSKKRLMKKLGFVAIDLSDLYFPVYTFQYTSAGGNSSFKCDIKLNVENLNNFVIYLSDLVKFRKSVVGQRALMTSSLREKIKERDNYTCQKCKISTNDEVNLLIEIDHIIPLSKGGITSEENLQALCWKCNRTKGAKIENEKVPQMSHF